MNWLWICWPQLWIDTSCSLLAPCRCICNVVGKGENYGWSPVGRFRDSKNFPLSSSVSNSYQRCQSCTWPRQVTRWRCDCTLALNFIALLQHLLSKMPTFRIYSMWTQVITKTSLIWISSRPTGIKQGANDMDKRFLRTASLLPYRHINLAAQKVKTPFVCRHFYPIFRYFLFLFFFLSNKWQASRTNMQKPIRLPSL
jgi:hypothetical protein